MLKRIATLMTLLMGLSLLAAVPLAGAQEAGGGETPQLVSQGEVVRLSGANRFATSARTGTALWPDGASTVILATGFDYPDALAGGALAAHRDAPLMLATTHSLPPEVRDALVELAPSEVILLGGGAALSSTLEEEVRALPSTPNTTRLAGQGRFETAEQVATAAGRDGNGDVVVATGFDFPDAVAAGALTAGAQPMPVILATRDQLVTGLASNEHAYLIGGGAALSAQLEQQAREQARAVDRLSGSQRFATSQAVADFALQRRLTGQVPLIVATGQQFPDALSAGAVTARAGGPLLLIPTGGPTPDQTSWISNNRQRFTGAIIIGGGSAVSPEAEQQIRNLLNPDPGPDPDPDPDPSDCVDINRENDRDELQRIIHIGPERVDDLIAHRPYDTLDQLERINGIGPARVQDIKDQGLAAVQC